MVFCLILLIINVREKKGADYVKQEEKVKILKSLKTMFSETDRTVILMLIAIFFLNSGYYVGETFLSSYVSVVLGFSDYAAAVMLGVFMGFIEAVRENEGDIKLTDMSPKIFRVFDLLGFPTLYDIFDNEEEAKERFA